MIKGEATIQFGSGSVASISGVDKDSGIGVMLMKGTSPGKIGRDIPHRLEVAVINDPDVAIYFTNIESVDSMLANLTAIREGMVEHKEVTDEAN